MVTSDPVVAPATSAPAAPAAPDAAPDKTPPIVPVRQEEPIDLSTLSGWVQARGPYKDLEAYCRAIHPEADSCGVRRGSAAASGTIPGLGLVDVFEAGDEMEKSIGLAITSGDGVFVAEDLFSEGGGNEWFTTLVATRIVEGTGPGVVVHFEGRTMKRVDDGSGLPGAAMPVEETDFTRGVHCGVARDGHLGCVTK